MSRHEARCTLSYTSEQLFDLAADVERYPEFLPWCVAARVHRSEGNIYHTDQVFGVGVFRERFKSKTVLQRSEKIAVTSTSKMFRKFELIWLFDSLPDSACGVTIIAELELRSKIVQDLFQRNISQTVGSIMSAFEARAHQIYDLSAQPSPTPKEDISNDLTD